VQEIPCVLVSEIRNPGDKVRLVLLFDHAEEAQLSLSLEKPSRSHDVDVCERFIVINFKVRGLCILSNIEEGKNFVSGI
jgi:hypothetical protein